MTSIAAIIIGIDGWQQYTLPLLESLRQHEPSCEVVVIDNASAETYPRDVARWARVERTPRLCYSAAINTGKSWLDSENVNADWYIVLSNDVLCTGPFSHLLAPLPPCVAGPQLWHEHGLQWIVGWCVASPRVVWDDIGGWDSNFIMSSWEDVSYSTSAIEKGYALYQMPELPFIHLDQKQRFGLPGYAGSESHNYNYFVQKHGMVRA